MLSSHCANAMATDAPLRRLNNSPEDNHLLSLQHTAHEDASEALPRVRRLARKTSKQSCATHSVLQKLLKIAEAKRKSFCTILQDPAQIATDA